MRRALMAAVALTVMSAPLQAGDVELKVIKLKQLHEAIAKHQGKVVVVDFWATFCTPCKEEFPNLVDIHQKQAKAGVACISVTIDDAEDKADALKFLMKSKAEFENYLLDETAEDWQKGLGFESVPTILVYGKDGKLVKKFNAINKETVFTYKDVRQLVDSLLAK